MKERPILFNGEMVRAILSGAKTQTRRVVKDRGWASEGWASDDDNWPMVSDGYAGGKWYRLACPYGQPGDRLWVRETWARLNDEGMEYFEYRADSDAPLPGQWPAEEKHDKECPRWRPSIHMPRLVSRITLEVTNVRVERLQDISESDARAEGCEPWVHGHGPASESELSCEPGMRTERMYRNGFEVLWNSINPKRAPWSSNPLVWVVEFKRIET